MGSNKPKNSKDKAELKENPRSNGKGSGEIIKDARFSSANWDPKFREAPKHKSKVKIDSRFTRYLLKNRNFAPSKAPIDKRGKLKRKDSAFESLNRYYHMEGDEGSAKRRKNKKGDDSDSDTESESEKLKIEVVGTEKRSTKIKENKIKESQIEDKEEFEGKKSRLRLKSQPESSDMESEEEEVEEDSDDSSTSLSDIDDDQVYEEEEETFGQQEDNIPEIHKETHRLAVVNMDLSHVKAVDLFVVLSSFLPKGGQIKSVAVYPSEFGLKRMEEEAIHGPIGIFDNDKKKSGGGEGEGEGEGGEDEDEGDDEDEDEDEDEGDDEDDDDEDDDDDDEIDNEKLRAYELSRLRYYFAVVECDSVATADYLYEGCDGVEFEGSSVKLDLRFIIPDSMECKHQPRDVATEAPSNYEGLDFFNRALQHSNINLTWDDDEPHRVKALKRKFNADQLAELELNEFLASDESESDDTEDDDDGRKDPDTKKKEKQNLYHAVVQSGEVTLLSRLSSSMTGIPGSLAEATLPPVIPIPPPAAELSDPDWVGDCHLGQLFPAACGVCRGRYKNREAMPLVINRRNANAAAAEEAKRKREEAAEKVEATITPTVHVGLNRGSSVNEQVTVAVVGSEPGSGANPQERAKLVGQAKRALETGEGSIADPDPKKKKKMASPEDDVVDFADDDIIPRSSKKSAPANITATLSPSASPSQPLYFDKEFVADTSVPGWRKKMCGALADVPPLPNLAKKVWDPWAKVAVGEGLIRRIAATSSVAKDIPPSTCLDVAVAEFGVASHAISTCLLSALEGMKKVDARDAKLREELRVAKETQAKLAAEKQVEMEQITAELQAKIDEAKKISEAAELKTKTLEAHLAKALSDLSAEKAGRKKAEAALEISCKNRKAAEEAANAANKRAEEAEASVPAKIEAAIKGFQNSDAFWDFLMASYDSGLYHMARCIWRDAEQGKTLTPTLQDFAAYTQEDGFSEELVRHHPVIPFSESEMKEFNAGRVKDRLPVLEFPAIVTPNMRALQKELEQKRAEAQKAAAEAEEAAAQQAKNINPADV